MGQSILMAGYLGQDGGNLSVQHEVGILDEKAPDSAEIDGWKEILKVNIEYVLPLLMLYGVRNDRTMSLESMR